MKRRLIPFLWFLALQSAVSPRVFSEESESVEAKSEPQGTGDTETPASPSESSEKSGTEETKNETPPSEAKVESEADKQANEAQRSERKAGVAKLIQKLTRADGQMAPIAVLTPLDYTTGGVAELAQETIIAALERYGKFDVRVIEYTPGALTLEEFRKCVTRYNVDVVLLTVLKPTNFDIFLYDRRTPYQIYAHSEPLPEAVQYDLTKPAVEEYTKVIVRRSLFAFMQGIFFELPREEARTFLSAEIPRYIANEKSFLSVNREILSSFYGAVSVGAALASGATGLWTSNLVGLQFGAKVWGNYYGELDIDMFSYNSIGATVKYMFANREKPFRFTLGLGVATMMNQKTLNWDQNYTQGGGGSYVVPCAAFSFPVVDMHFKIESKVFVGLGGGKFIFALMPGMLFMF